MRAFAHFTSPVRIPGGLLILILLACGVTSCKSPQEPPEARRAETNLAPGWPRGNNFFHQASYQRVGATLPTIQDAEYVNDDEVCANCHAGYAKSFNLMNVHRGNSCEACHGPASRHVETRGKEPGMIFSFKTADPIVRAEACLRCHEENQCSAGSQWRTSKHAQCRVDCVQCHRGHYDVPVGTPPTTEPGQTTSTESGKLTLTSYAEPVKPPAAKDSTKDGKLPSLKGKSNNLGAVAPGICYRCHSDYQEYQRIAGPHQICGPNGFNCTTCHDPHGQIRESTREELCLKCHGPHAPTMAWESSIHHQNGVNCTDCHNPHPQTHLQRMVQINHENIVRPKRMQMAVQQPETCYKCHQKTFGQFAMPNHHPIREGKMVCSDCHDAHGQATKNLKEPTVNLLCFKCHAEKQGPFVFEHPPVTENCLICHQPHGSVADNLLRQPSPFLCLRCHSGHNNHNQRLNDGTVNPQDGTTQGQRYIRGLYTNCSQCHPAIHGSDRISNSGKARFTR